MKIVIVGAGILGLSCAYQLRQRFPDAEISVLEKESECAQHQSGRNSGVIHSGVYYTPGSAKALNCRRGRLQLLEFCQEFDVPHELCGKVIVAVNEDQRAKLHDLHQRGQTNGVDCRLIQADELREREPHARGVEALLVPDAGIADYRKMCGAMLRESRAELFVKTQVQSVLREAEGLRVLTTRGEFVADFLVNCAGLQCDRVSAMSGFGPPLRIVPFKGEYYELKESAHHLCRHLIYPVPDPRFPFLGVHLTRMIDGRVEAGPSAVLALGREAYGKTAVNWRDLLETLSYSGFQRLAKEHWRMGLKEFQRFVFKAAFVKALQELCPEIQADDLFPRASGIRAQALHPDGRLEDDFVILQDQQMLHLLNAPSPAATSCLAIGESLAGRIRTD